MFILFIAVVALAFWVRHLRARLNLADRRILEIERIASDARAKSEQVARLTARIAALEAAAMPAPAARPSDTPAVIRTAAAPAVTPPVAATPVTPPAAAPAAPLTDTPEPMAAPVAPAQSIPPAEPALEDAWEVTVGGSWLNK